jgi:hypothetical protein
MNNSIFKKYGYAWVTFLFFLLSIIGHWVFAWHSYVQEQIEHKESVEISGYINETLRDTFENWQSEFLQLIWQVGGLSLLLYAGSPQSKEGDDRKEEKLDFIINKLDSKTGKKFIKDLESKYPKK